MKLRSSSSLLSLLRPNAEATDVKQNYDDDQPSTAKEAPFRKRAQSARTSSQILKATSAIHRHSITGTGSILPTAAKARRNSSVGSFETYSKTKNNPKEKYQESRSANSSKSNNSSPNLQKRPLSRKKRELSTSLSQLIQTSRGSSPVTAGLSSAARSLASSKDSLSLSIGTVAALPVTAASGRNPSLLQMVDRRLSILEEVSGISDSARITTAIADATKVPMSSLFENAPPSYPSRSIPNNPKKPSRYMYSSTQSAEGPPRPLQRRASVDIARRSSITSADTLQRRSSVTAADTIQRRSSVTSADTLQRRSSVTAAETIQRRPSITSADIAQRRPSLTSADIAQRRPSLTSADIPQGRSSTTSIGSNEAAKAKKTSLEEKKQLLIQSHLRRKSLDASQLKSTMNNKNDNDEEADQIEEIDISKPTISDSMSRISASESQSSIQSRGSIVNLRLATTGPPASKKISLKSLMKKAAKQGDKSKKSRLSHRSKNLWIRIVFSLKFAASSSRAAQRITSTKFKELQELVTAKATEKTLTELLKDMAKDADNVCSYKLKNLLQIPPKERNFDIVQKINTIMIERIPDFAKAFVDEQERLHICKYLRYDFLKKDTVLLWEEHICTCFYFLIYGRVDIFKLNKGSKLKLAVMKGCAIFGHARIKVENATRSACAVLLQDSLLLTIERDDYVGYVQDLTSLHPKVIQLSKLSFFASNKDVFEKLSRFFQLGMYKAGSVIHNQSSPLTRLYWVVEGEIVITQKIGIVTYKKTLRPYVEAIDEPLGPEHHLSYLNLETNRLGPGAWFPKLPEVGEGAHLVQYLGAEYLDNVLYRDYFLERQVELKVPYAIHAEKDTILASVSFAEIGQIMPRDILYELVYVAMVHSFPTADLQEQYLQQVTWEGHKKRELDDFKLEMNRSDAVDFNFDL